MNNGSLDIQSVTVHFGGVTALDDVSLTAAPRKITGIIGPNGAGKTTLLNTACGFVRPQSGTVSFDGRPLTNLSAHRLAGLGIARTLQGVGLFRGLSVVENVMVGATAGARAGVWSALFGLPRSDRDERRLREQAMRALDEVGAADLADQMPDTLAYGLRKRVALARAPGRAAPDAAARRAGRRLPRERAPRAGRADQEDGRRRGRGRHRAPDGPGDVGLRHDLRAGLRQADRRRHAGSGPGQSRRHRRVPRH